MSAVNTAGPLDTHEDTDREDVPVLDGVLVDPELLRAIQRVAHREYLLGPAQTQSYRHPLTRPVRHRPSAVRPVRTVRGTTARKVTWSR